MMKENVKNGGFLPISNHVLYHFDATPNTEGHGLQAADIPGSC